MNTIEGISYGKKTTWDDHFAHHPNEKEKNDFLRLEKLYEDGRSTIRSKRVYALLFAIAEFGPLKERRAYRERLRKTISQGWKPFKIRR